LTGTAFDGVPLAGVAFDPAVLAVEALVAGDLDAPALDPSVFDGVALDVAFLPAAAPATTAFADDLATGLPATPAARPAAGADGGREEAGLETFVAGAFDPVVRVPAERPPDGVGPADFVLDGLLVAALVTEGFDGFVVAAARVVGAAVFVDLTEAAEAEAVVAGVFLAAGSASLSRPSIPRPVWAISAHPLRSSDHLRPAK
jgi:hypothetical protein